MTIPIGPLRLQIAVSLSRSPRRCWELLTSVGMTDRELAHLNVPNTARHETTHFHWHRSVISNKLNRP